MDIKRRSGLKGTLATPGTAPKNAVSQRVNGSSQAKGIKNTSGGTPSAVGVTKVRNAVNGPNQ